MKRVRILLRVSSSKQLDADGDLSVQRRLVKEYVERHKDWQLDEKEYFEGSNSGYQNAVSQRDILQEALADAQNGEYDILAAYKDDRIGRRMWEIGAYVMTLKSCNVDIYTVKDGCISPENDDIMGQIMLALRYGNAQKSSSDTGMRVKDTAEKLVREGKFMGGAPPYGYRLTFSGELSKHGRALHKLEIVPEQAALVQKIYELSCYREFGSVKIAGLLNASPSEREMAPGNEWKSGTISGILSNPVYTGHAAYKRREQIGGKCRRNNRSDWVTADNPNPEIRIIDDALWQLTQQKRKARAARFQKKAQMPECDTSIPVISRNDGVLPLRDILFCGFCGRKMVNGTRYSYWTLQSTGEKKSRKIPLYRCPASHNGIPHNQRAQFRADMLEQIVSDCLAEHIGSLLRQEDITALYRKMLDSRRKNLEAGRRRAETELAKLTQDIQLMRQHIPDAISGNYPLPVTELAHALRQKKERITLLEETFQETKMSLEEVCNNIAAFSSTLYSFGQNVSSPDSPTSKTPGLEKVSALPAWPQLLENASPETKRVLTNRLIERIEVSGEQILIRFRG